MRPSSIALTIDLGADGKRHGHMRLPHSHDDSAWGSIMIPITVVKNGRGPTALLTGGNHGDEFEGPIALWDLARRLEPEEVSGRVIIVPAMNFPAFQANRRCSPIDGVNLNRAFPGDPGGTVTFKVADYFQRHLLPLADVVLDFHSGGRTMDLLPFAAAHVLPDASQEAACFAGVSAFGAPYAMRMREIDAYGMYDTAAEEMGKIFVTTELRGGGTATAGTVEYARTGVRNLLIHSGILAGEIVARESVWLSMEADGCFIFCDTPGLVEPHVDLGARLVKGQPILSIHPTHVTGAEPTVYRAPHNGILAGKLQSCLAAMGDNLAVVATIEDTGQN